MSNKESQMRKAIIEKAINFLTHSATHTPSIEVCASECFLVAMNDPEMREYMATRSDRQVARMGGEAKRGVDRYLSRKTVREVYIAHNTLGHTGHKVYFKRVSRDGSDRIERWYGVEQGVTESSLKRLNRVLLINQIGVGISGEWTVGSGIYKEGMYTRLWR